MLMIMENKPAAENPQPVQDVVAPPPPEPAPAEAPAEKPADKPTPKPKVQKPQTGNSATPAIVAAILILLGLSALAVYAYLNN